MYSHIAGFRWLFLFTLASALLLMLWGLCEVAELSEVPAKPFCCCPVCLLTNIWVLVFQACSWDTWAYLQEESTGSGSTKCCILKLCSPAITSGSTRVIPILISLLRQNCSQEGSVLYLPRTRLGVSSSFQIILWMVLKWNSSMLSVQPEPVFSLDIETMGIGCCLLCWGSLSSRGTCLVGCGRTSSLITVKISNSSSYSYSWQKWVTVGSSGQLSHSGGAGDSHSSSPAIEGRGTSRRRKGILGSQAQERAWVCCLRCDMFRILLGLFICFNPFLLFFKPLRKGFERCCSAQSCLRFQRVLDPSVDNTRPHVKIV